MRSAELQPHQIVKPLEAAARALLAAIGLLSVDCVSEAVSGVIRFLCFVAVDSVAVLPICPRRSFTPKPLCDCLKLVIFDS